jgi:hypothetical protein
LKDAKLTIDIIVQADRLCWYYYFSPFV